MIYVPTLNPTINLEHLPTAGPQLNLSHIYQPSPTLSSASSEPEPRIAVMPAAVTLSATLCKQEERQGCEA